MEKIIKRMQNLLAMSQDTSSEHEAAIAMKRLHSLLAKHNVSMAELNTTPDTVEDSDGFETYNWPWKRIVLNAVGNLYFCKSYYSMTRKNYANYFLVGTESNRMFAEAIVKMIFSSIEKEAKMESKKAYGKINNSFVTAFRTSAAHTISRRCQELVKMAKDGNLEDEDGSLLPVMLSVYEQNALAAQAFMDKMNTRKGSSRTYAKNLQGALAGQEAGNKVQLSRSLQSKNSIKQIGSL